MSDTENTIIQAEPTMRDLFEMMKRCANKDDISEISAQITAHNKETSAKIELANKRIDNVIMANESNTNRVELLEASIETLKQEQIRNNICISGVPSNTLANSSTTEIVIAIAKSLGIEIAKHNFTSYAVANNKFIIVNMHNIRHKQLMLNKIRVKKSLMVEEVLAGTSNSQI